MKGYTLVEKLGQGGMGIVYRAIQRGLEREVALKILPGAASEDEELVHRFHREFKTISNLHHPNIVRVFDFGEQDGVLWYAMELVAGHDLYGQGALPFERVLPLLEQASDALAYLHERDLYHRDIKPQNLCVDAAGRLVLLDFGLVKPKESTLLTESGTIVGTLRFLAPEVALGGPATGPADVYALALTAQELITGEHAITAERAQDLYRKVAHAEVTPLPPGLPTWFKALHARATSADPAARPTAAEYRDVIRTEFGSGRIVALTPKRLRVPSRSEQNATRKRQTSPRAQALAIGGALLVAVVAVTAFALSWRARGPERARAPATPAPTTRAPSDRACAETLARSFVLWPTERSAFVDFDVPRGTYRIEVGDWSHRTVSLVRTCPAPRGFVQMDLEPLVSDTDHFIRVRRENGVVVLFDHRFRTRETGHGRAVHAAVGELVSRPKAASEMAGFFQQYPDSRGVPAVLTVAGVDLPESMIGYGKIAIMARKLRNEALGQAIFRQLPKVGGIGLRAEMLLASVQARVPEALTYALGATDITTRSQGAEAAARAVELIGGPVACQAFSRLVERGTPAPRFAGSMVSADPEIARSHAERWLRPGAPENELAAALTVMVELGDDAAAGALERALPNPRPPASAVVDPMGWPGAPNVADALAAIATPRARGALARALEARPADPGLLLAAVRAGGTESLATLERLARAGGSLKREALAALGSCAPERYTALFKAALADPDTEVASVAAWALARKDGASTIAVPAGVSWVHTGVYVKAGESVELTTNGTWGRAGSDPARVDATTVVDETLPPLGITALIGTARWRVYRRAGRLLASKGGELTLSCWQYPPDAERVLARPPLAGQAYVTIAGSASR